MWQVHVFQHPNVALCVDAHALFEEARRENDAVHHRGANHGAWVALAVLVDAHIGIEICLSCGPPVGPNHPNRAVLRGSLVVPAEELLVGEHHARQVQRLQLPFATDREHAHALQHVAAEVHSCQARCGRQSRRTDSTEQRHNRDNGEERRGAERRGEKRRGEKKREGKRREEKRRRGGGEEEER